MAGKAPGDEVAVVVIVVVRVMVVMVVVVVVVGVVVVVVAVVIVPMVVVKVEVRGSLDSPNGASHGWASAQQRGGGGGRDGGGGNCGGIGVGSRVASVVVMAVALVVLVERCEVAWGNSQGCI